MLLKCLSLCLISALYNVTEWMVYRPGQKGIGRITGNIRKYHPKIKVHFKDGVNADGGKRSCSKATTKIVYQKNKNNF